MTPVRALSVMMAFAAGLSAQPRPADSRDVLRVVAASLPPQLANPFQSALPPAITTNGALFDGLTRYGRDGAVGPWLATAWEPVDARTWRFTLREDVLFSNGAALTAASVAGVVHYLAGQARPTDNIVREVPALASARAVDARTVEIVTRDPVPLFPRYATLLLVPEIGALIAHGPEAFARSPVGTGPYVLDDWSPGRAKFKAFAASWRAPRVPRLEIIPLPDVGNRVQALLAGQADIALGIGFEEGRALTDADLKLEGWPSDTVSGIALVTNRTNGKPTPFADARVRRALNMAVDRAAIAATILDGRYRPANQPAQAGMLGHDPDLPPIPYDPDGARALLAEAGYPDGFTFTMETSAAVGSDNAVYQQVAADLRRVGVVMEVRVLPPPQFIKNVFFTGEYADAVTVPWTGMPVGDFMRGIEMHSCAHAVPWTCDPDVMPLIEAIRTEPDAEKALALRRQLMGYYHAQLPAIFLFESMQFTGAAADVRGFVEMFGFVPYDRIWFAAPP